MTDRPTPEQQLAEVIGGALWPSSANKIAAAAIVAAVNTGDIDPIVPDGKVVATSAWTLYDLRSENERLRLESGLLDATNAEMGDRIVELEAELASLRALKAKVDGWSSSIFDGNEMRFHDQQIGWEACIAWLRGGSDG